jgi:hypothetical protein
MSLLRLSITRPARAAVCRGMGAEVVLCGAYWPPFSGPSKEFTVPDARTSGDTRHPYCCFRQRSVLSKSVKSVQAYVSEFVDNERIKKVVPIWLTKSFGSFLLSRSGIQ